MVDAMNHDSSKQQTTHDPKKKYTQSLLKPNIQTQIKWDFIITIN